MKKKNIWKPILAIFLAGMLLASCGSLRRNMDSVAQDRTALSGTEITDDKSGEAEEENTGIESDSSGAESEGSQSTGTESTTESDDEAEHEVKVGEDSKMESEPLAEDERTEFGVRDGDYYESEDLGYGCFLPHWAIDEEEELREYEGTFGTISPHGNTDGLGHRYLVVDFFAVSPDGMDSVMISYENMVRTRGTIQSENTIYRTFLEGVEKDLGLQGYSEVSAEEVRMELGGREVRAIAVKATLLDIPTYQRHIFIKCGSYIGSISIVSLVEDNTDEVAALFYPLENAPEHTPAEPMPISFGDYAWGTPLKEILSQEVVSGMRAGEDYDYYELDDDPIASEFFCNAYRDGYLFYRYYDFDENDLLIAGEDVLGVIVEEEEGVELFLEIADRCENLYGEPVYMVYTYEEENYASLEEYAAAIRDYALDTEYFWEDAEGNQLLLTIWYDEEEGMAMSLLTLSPVCAYDLNFDLTGAKAF